MMKLSKETSIFKDNAISGGISDASKTATDYITRIDENGITIHPSGSTSSRIELDAGGMEVFKGGSSVAEYGDTARIGRSSAARFLMGATSLQAYDSSNSKYFEVSASGMTFGSSTAATTADIPTTVAQLSDSFALAAAAVCAVSAAVCASSALPWAVSAAV